jgi:cell wall-associated NlpC family hydrolase
MSNLTALVDELQLVNNQIGRKLDLIGAVADSPTMTLTIDGASTLDVVVADHERELITSQVLDERSWAVAAGVHFELVRLAKSGDHVTLTFEDAIIAELRRHTKPRSFHAGKVNRRQVAAWFAKEARVPYKIDPDHKEKIHNAIQRSAGGQKNNSWEVLGSDVADPINWRRFSDGTALIVGGDDWLTSGYKKPVAIRENTDGVGSIDFDLDIAKRASTCKATIDTRLRGFMPGAPVTIDQLGPADGLWLVSEISQRLSSSRADLTLTRKAPVLKEPKRSGGSKKAGNDKDSGAKHYLPGQGGDAGSGRASNSARERMVSFALAQKGKPYLGGASGPGAYDCSGLVQAASRAAGKTLGRPAASQWATCRAAGKTISVSQALGIRGALLFRLGGDYNHVAFSLGNGSTVEARGTAYGCGVFGNASGQGWTGAALWL